jgi:hypothetical protein
VVTLGLSPTSSSDDPVAAVLRAIPVPATRWDPTLSAVMASVRCAVYEQEVRVSLLDAINSVAGRGH